MQGHVETAGTGTSETDHENVKAETMNRQYYRVVSGSMKVLLWANGYRQAIRKARKFRNWRRLGSLTKFQVRSKNGKDWFAWCYVKTEVIK